jgi:hypothetical protein
MTILERILSEAIRRNVPMVDALNAMLSDGTASIVFEAKNNGDKNNGERVRLALYNRFAVEVDTASHDDLKNGITASCTSKVVVMAENDTEAVLIATQMAACNRRDAMPTRAALLDFPTEW